MKVKGGKKPRILALDLGETLLRSDLTISPRVKAAIEETRDMDLTIVLVSGRILSSVDYFSGLLGLRDRPGFLVCNYGALVQESDSGKIIHEAFLDRETVLAVCDLAGADDFPVQIYDGNVIYVSMENEYTCLEQKLTGVRQVVVENFRAMVGEGCYKLIIPGDPQTLAYAEALIVSFLGKKVSLSNSRPYYLELMADGTDKCSALAKIADYMGVNAAEIMAVGDSMNDETMIRWAGTGVAMANADERIKNIADIVTEKSNDEDGVAELIEKYFLEKEN
jgi:Cof subfamily protein (haloacid dehalogenase superfamily)